MTHDSVSVSPPERLPRLRPSQLDGAAAAVYRAITESRAGSTPRAVPLVDSDGALEGPFNAMLFSPDVGFAVQALGRAIRFGSRLSDRERESAILLCAFSVRSEYEVATHRPLALRAGWSDDDVAALGRGVVPPGASAGEAAGLALVRAVLATGRVEGSRAQRGPGGPG